MLACFLKNTKVKTVTFAVCLYRYKVFAHLGYFIVTVRYPLYLQKSFGRCDIITFDNVNFRTRSMFKTGHMDAHLDTRCCKSCFLRNVRFLWFYVITIKLLFSVGNYTAYDNITV